MEVIMDFASKSSVGISLIFSKSSGCQGPLQIEGHNHVHFKRNGSVKFA